MSKTKSPAGVYLVGLFSRIGLLSVFFSVFIIRAAPTVRVSNQILTVIHKETTVPGRVGSKLAELGYVLDIRAPIFGEALPDELDAYAAVLVFGGPMSVNDDEPYIHKEMTWIRRVLDENVPYLGICLGAQLLAKVLGAEVAPHAEALEEIGYYPVYATDAGKDLFPPQMKIYQWHKDGFDLPAEAVLLARGDDFPHQAFRWGDRTYGIQFHPEMTADMVDFWTTNGADIINAPDASANIQSRAAQMAAHGQHSDSVDRWLETFLKNWLGKDT